SLEQIQPAKYFAGWICSSDFTGQQFKIIRHHWINKNRHAQSVTQCVLRDPCFACGRLWARACPRVGAVGFHLAGGAHAAPLSSEVRTLYSASSSWGAFRCLLPTSRCRSSSRKIESRRISRSVYENRSRC